MRLNLKEKGVKRERGKTDEGTICSVTLYFLSRPRGKRAVERNTCYLITVSWMSCVLCAFLLAPSLMFKKKNLIHLVCRSHYSGVGLLDMGLDNCLLSIKCFCCLSTLFRLVFFTQLCYWKEAMLQQKSCHWPKKKKNPNSVLCCKRTWAWCALFVLVFLCCYWTTNPRELGKMLFFSVCTSRVNPMTCSVSWC